MTIFDVMYGVGVAGALWFAFSWVHEVAEARYKRRERRSLEDQANYLGAIDGSARYGYDEPCPHVMSTAASIALSAAAESEVVREQWEMFYLFQLGRRQGWEQAFQCDVDMTDLDAEFATWLRKGEAA